MVKKNVFPYVTIILIGISFILTGYILSASVKDREEFEKINRQVISIKAKEYLNSNLSEKEKLEEYIRLLDKNKLSYIEGVKLAFLHFKFRNSINAFWEDYFKNFSGTEKLRYLHLVKSLEEKESTTLLIRYLFYPAKEFNIVRLITSPFIHLNYIHLVISFLFLYIAGSTLEPILGYKRFLFIVIISLLFSFALEGVIASSNKDIYFAGLGGAIYGLLGIFSLRYFSSKMSLYLIVDFLVAPAYVIVIAWFLIDNFLRLAISPLNCAIIPFGYIGVFLFGGVSSYMFSKEKLSEKQIKQGARPSEIAFDMEGLTEIEIAKRFISKGDIQKGIIKLQSFLAKNPDDLEAHYELFNALLLSKIEPKARLEANRIIGKYRILGKFKEILKIYEDFNKVFPETPMEIPDDLKEK